MAAIARHGLYALAVALGALLAVTFVVAIGPVTFWNIAYAGWTDRPCSAPVGVCDPAVVLERRLVAGALFALGLGCALAGSVLLARGPHDLRWVAGFGLMWLLVPLSVVEMLMGLGR